MDSSFGLTEEQRLAKEKEERSIALVEIQRRDERSFPALGVSRTTAWFQGANGPVAGDFLTLVPKPEQQTKWFHTLFATNLRAHEIISKRVLKVSDTNVMTLLYCSDTHDGGRREKESHGQEKSPESQDGAFACHASCQTLLRYFNFMRTISL